MSKLAKELLASQGRLCSTVLVKYLVDPDIPVLGESGQRPLRADICRTSLSLFLCPLILDANYTSRNYSAVMPSLDTSFSNFFLEREGSRGLPALTTDSNDVRGFANRHHTIQCCQLLQYTCTQRYEPHRIKSCW